ncbi:MAG: beta-galactosidase [Elusimicrobia bacterium]|nr:beta-galactosidase [Elusimicrobiota bacterium]
MQPTTMKVENGQFILNKKPFYLYSGEIHYFRIPQKYWKDHVRKAKAAGLNCVSSYIPWNWHESEQGKFDFEGKSHPQKNLIAFLKEVKKADLYFSARVGPVSNAELVNEGIPGWLLKDHPELYVQRSSVNNLPHALLLSYLNPKFLEYVGKWYDAVLPLVQENQIHKNGPIVLVQLCNEISMIHWLHKAYDESAPVNKMYQDFLKEEYQDIKKLNSAYSSNYNEFKDIHQPQEDFLQEHWQIFLDWSLFYRRYYAAYFKKLQEKAVQSSLSVPFSANIPQFYDYDVRGRGVYSPMTCSMFRDFSLQVPKTVFGGAYQMRRLDFENFHDVGITTEMTKMLDKESPSICAELQTGILRDRPRLYPQDIDLNLKTSTAHGLNGVNCYMFSSGENLPGLGAFGSYHDWQAPVSLDGIKTKEHFAPLKEWGKLIKKYGSQLAETKKINDTAIGFYVPYYATEYFSGQRAFLLESQRTNFFFDGFARLLQLANYNYSFLDLLKESKEELLKNESLSVFTLDSMDEETQNKLADYAQSGGKLLFGPRVPNLNLSGKPCVILAEKLGISFQEEKIKQPIVWKGIEAIVDFPIHTFNIENKFSLAKTKTGFPCAFYGKAGLGNFIVYGFGLNHVFDYQVQMVREWMETLKVFPFLKFEPWDLQGTLRWDKMHSRGFLFLFNYHDVKKKGAVSLKFKDQKIKEFKKRFTMEERSGVVLPLELIKNKVVEVVR